MSEEDLFRAGDVDAPPGPVPAAAAAPPPPPAAAPPPPPAAPRRYPPFPAAWNLLAKASWAAYGRDVAHVRARLAPSFGPHGEELVFAHLAKSPAMPGHLVILSSALRAIVIAVRGTANMEDLNVDARGQPVVADGLAWAHAGFAACAAHIGGAEHGAVLAAALRASGALPPAAGSVAGAGAPAGETLYTCLAALLAARPGWAVYFTGHSLGGSVASLLALLSREHFFEADNAAAGRPPEPSSLVAALSCRQPVFVFTLGAAPSGTPVMASAMSLTRAEATALLALPPGEEHDAAALVPLLRPPRERYYLARTRPLMHEFDDDWPLAVGIVHGTDLVPRLALSALKRIRLALNCPPDIRHSIDMMNGSAAQRRSPAAAPAPEPAAPAPAAGDGGAAEHLAHGSVLGVLASVLRIKHAADAAEAAAGPAAGSAPATASPAAHDAHCTAADSAAADAAAVLTPAEAAAVGAHMWRLAGFRPVEPGSAVEALRRRLILYTVRCAERATLVYDQPLVCAGVLVRVMPLRAPRAHGLHVGGGGGGGGAAAVAGAVSAGALTTPAAVAAAAAHPSAAAAAYTPAVAPPAAFSAVHVTSHMVSDHGLR